MSGLRFGVIGCGAISEALYLPVLSKTRSICSELHLVDTDPNRLDAMARKFGARSTALGIDSLFKRIDVAVVATPPATHFPIGTALITAGKHVFCEKPLTIQPIEAEQLVRAATQANVILMINNIRRNWPALQRIHAIVRSEELGRPIGATWREGNKFTWPTQSGYYFTQRGADGSPAPGVLLDMGAHIVDTLQWWFGDPSIADCRTDSFGGPDARARLVLDFNGMPAVIEFSSYQRLTNAYEVAFERGMISGLINQPRRFRMRKNGVESVVKARSGGDWAQTLCNFAAVVSGKERPSVTAEDVLPSVRTIAEAYRVAKPFDQPWLPRWNDE